MRTKKITAFTAVILVIACIFCLVACDNGNDAIDASEISDSQQNTSTNVVTPTAVTAYEIAVKHGFVGTEEDWLNSLKGEASEVSFTIEDLYDAAVSAGFSGDFLDFVNEYFSADATVDGTYAVSKAILSAVIVKSKFTVTTYNIWGQPSLKTATSGGAGVIYKLDKVNGDAYIITNFHVVYEASSNTSDHLSDDVTVFLYGTNYENDSMGIPATVVGGSAYYDIAVLKVTGSSILSDSDARAADINEEDVTVGETATAIGFPAGEGMSVTSGIVSVDSEKINVAVDGTNSYPLRVMRVDAAINSGNSGGGLFDADGKLIGIVNARYNSTSIENIGYGIPVYIATSVADNVIAYCNGTTKVAVYKCSIGVTTAADYSKMVYNADTGKTSIVENVKVVSTTDDGLVKDILQEGDLLISVTLNGVTKTINRNHVLGELLLNARVGDTLTITFQRDGVEQSAEIVLTVDSFSELYVK